LLLLIRLSPWAFNFCGNGKQEQIQECYDFADTDFYPQQLVFLLLQHIYFVLLPHRRQNYHTHQALIGILIACS